MAKNRTIILLALASIIISISGCMEERDATSAIKALPEVKQYMERHPDAKITVTYWSKEEVENASHDIGKQCGKTIVPAALYKAVISEGSLQTMAWINQTDLKTVCFITESIQGTMINTPSNSSIPMRMNSPKAPDVNITAGNLVDTPEADIAILFAGEDIIRGGEWKISIVPAGNPPKFITSGRWNDLSYGNVILAIATTEGTPVLSEGVLAGDRLFSPGAIYDVKLVHLPANVVLLDTLVKVSGLLATTVKEPTYISAPITSAIVTNFPDTPALDLKIEHKGGDTLKGGDWKLSVVPVGNPVQYVTSTKDSDLSTGDQIIATTTTEGATSITDTQLSGGVALISNKLYDVKFVHLPSKVLIIDMIVEVR